MDDDGNLREDLKLPEGDLGSDLQSRFEKDDSLLVSRLSFMSVALLCVFGCIKLESVRHLQQL